MGPDALCRCGCAGVVSIHRGRPRRFILGHNTPKGQFAGIRGRHWKGGRRTGRNGYVYLWRPDHPNARRDGYVLEHVVVGAAALGKQLPRRAIVHHVNGHKAENNGSNLVICEDRAYHILLHQRADAFRATGHPRAVRCCYCKRWIMPDDPELYLPPPRGANGRHRTCAREYRRQRRLV